MPRKVRNLEPSLWFSSGASTVGGGADDETVSVCIIGCKGGASCVCGGSVANGFAAREQGSTCVARRREIAGDADAG